MIALFFSKANIWRNSYIYSFVVWNQFLFHSRSFITHRICQKWCSCWYLDYPFNVNKASLLHIKLLLDIFLWTYNRKVQSAPLFIIASVFSDILNVRSSINNPECDYGVIWTLEAMFWLNVSGKLKLYNIWRSGMVSLMCLKQTMGRKMFPVNEESCLWFFCSPPVRLTHFNWLVNQKTN